MSNNGVTKYRKTYEFIKETQEEIAKLRTRNEPWEKVSAQLLSLRDQANNFEKEGNLMRPLFSLESS